MQAAERAAEAPANMSSLLRRKRALSEVKLRHPELPFLGVLDRVQLTAAGSEIVDFKTGEPNDKHRRQLLRYALLWWRTTGDLPVQVCAQYLDGAKSWPVTEGELAEIEADLARKIPLLADLLSQHPATPSPGEGCCLCPVRARCAIGWAVGEEAALVDGRGDAELVATDKPGDHGFLARSRAGAEVAVVYEASVARLLPQHVDGRVLRVLDGVWQEKLARLEIKAWTGVFVVEPEHSRR